MAKLTCPKCDEHLGLNEEWQLINYAKLGTTVTGGESIQGDYAHARCVL